MSLQKISNNEDYVSNVLGYLRKEIKQEDENVERVLLCGLSAFTLNPINLRILAPSSTGKTYIIEKTSNVFPQENIIKLASASARSFQYAHGSELVGENGEEIDNSEIKELQVKLSNATEKVEKKKIKAAIRSKKKLLEEQTWHVVDLSDKWVIFTDSQDSGLWNSLKSLLSHDSEQIKHQMTNKTGGSNKLQKVIFKGKPAVTYASAKDENSVDVTGEIESRFQTISLKASSEKYRQSMDLLGKKHGLGPFYEEEVSSKEELQSAKESVTKLIENMNKYGKSEHPVIDPFSKKISDIFPTDNGTRQREFDRLTQIVTINTLCNAHIRPKIVVKGIEYPIVYLQDIHKAVRLMQSSLGIPSHKIQFFNEYAKPAIQENGNGVHVETIVKGLIASEITDFYIKHKQGIKTDRKKILETYLKPLVNYGFLESQQDPRDKTRSIFWISSSYENKDAETESTLIDVSMLDKACVESYLDKILRRRLDENKVKVIDIDGSPLTLEELRDMVCTIDIKSVENRFKN